MNKLHTFQNPEFGNIRTVMIDGEPWFVGKDVAEALGYTNPRDALSKHVDDEDKKTVAIRDGIRGNPNVTVINESGVYSLILSSKLPNAKKFKRWVTADILPSLRKTGAYITDGVKRQQVEARLNNSRARLASVWLKVGNNVPPEYRQICSSYASAILTGGEAVIPLPIANAAKLYTATEVGELLGISANRVGTIANRNGLKSQPYGEYVWDKAKYCEKQVQTFLYSEQGIERIRKELLS